MQPEQTQVYKTLIQAGAESDRKVDLGHLSLATWHNNHGYAAYERANHHTLSFYLQGGSGTRRMVGEKSFGCGHPGAVCMLPAESRSEWLIESPLSFLHLYFDRQVFSQTIIENFDIDPTNIEIRDISFHSDPYIEHLCQNEIIPLDWQNVADQFSLSNSAERLLLHVFENYTNQKLRPKPYLGGLSPVIRQRVKNQIEDSLSTAITVGDLARTAGLSPFHFSRMFSASEGISPHQYVLSRRILKAKNLLTNTKLPLALIAQECGFSSQSHFSKRFQIFTSMTPKNFRKTHSGTKTT